ncbi:MAG: proliferating cell nuclear antigen (pcna) [Nanoarchaeota archaeon]|nr:proliferating cell nuclear antigen (pcna) [Nanoarchaeota archaeon]
MKLTLAEPKYLKDSIAIISELVTEARIKVSKDGLELVAMDPANVAMTVFKLFSSAFVEYDVKKDADLALNLGSLKQILRRAKPNDVLTLELTDSKLKITLKGAASKRTFSLSLIDMEDKDQRIPELNFPIKVETSSAVLNDAIEDVDIIAESVSLAVEPGKFIVEAEGDLSNANIEIKADDTTKVTAKDKVKAKYSIEYLKKMILGGKLADNVTIQFNKDYPLKLVYKEVDKVMLSFILAPRVEND